MKKIILSTSVIVLFLSCQNGTKPLENNQTNTTVLEQQVTVEEDTDAPTNWITVKPLKPIIFTNKITMKDGQNSEAGLSFLINMNGKTMIASCKHIMGTAGGFKEDITIDEIPKMLKKWEIKPLGGKKFVETAGKAEIEGYNDVFFLNTGKIDISGYTVLKPTKKMDKSKKYYLVGYDILGDEKPKLIPFSFLGEKGEFYLFNNVKEEMLEGLSGGPIVSENGNVVGTLNGFITSKEGKEITLVQKIQK